ncbi:MAG: sulfurtransferase complex subunit TusB [Anaerolineae bacterium]|nr:sulfurtransferase complex subunit TusB [Anaerolineae bacterium]
MLYTINKSPLMFGNLKSALRIAPEGEPVLLYEDGVYAAAHGAATEALVADALAKHPIFALKADLEARGITRLIDGIRVVDYDGFVALVEEHPVVPWL